MQRKSQPKQRFANRDSALTVSLIDAGPLVAYYNSGDKWHTAACGFFEEFKGNLLTTDGVVTEVMWLLADDWRVQNEFLNDLKNELYQAVPLIPADFSLIAELNEKYRDLPGDFADLSLIAISARVDVLCIASLDSDFDIYRACSGTKKFKQIFPKYSGRNR